VLGVKKAIALPFILIVLLSVLAGESFVSLVEANPLPAISPEIIIKSPQNTSYVGDTIVLNFTASSTWISSSISYSIDGLDKIAVNTITILQEDANIGKNPAIYRTTVEGTCALSHVSRGWHNITLFMICENKKFSYYETYFKGDIIASESVGFFVGAPEISLELTPTPAPTEEPTIEPEQDLTTGAVFAVTSIVIFLGLLYYFIKRK